MVQSKQVQDGGVQVVNVNAFLGRQDAVVVGLAVDDAFLDAAARQPG